jgi:hypothetical protein
MSNLQFTVEQFRTSALEKLTFLEGNGFNRVSSLEQTSPTSGTIVYLGKHVGFVFSLDVRDQCVDAQVVKVKDGQMKRNWEGGYSSDIFSHLVKYAGYRGSPGGSRKLPQNDASQADLQRMIDGWAELLKEAGQSLLSDKLESLPV